MIIDDHEISRTACCALLRTDGLNVTADLAGATSHCDDHG
jgi:hypothetical protein